MAKLVKINHEQKLYVYQCGDGISCKGFDYLHDNATKVHKWMGKNSRLAMPDPLTKGTEAHYRLCESILQAGHDLAMRTGKKCTADLVPALKKLEGKRVAAIVYGQLEVFTVARSTGWMPCHLMIEDGEVGGVPLHADSISAIREV